MKTTLVVLVLAILWEVNARILANPLIFPGFLETVVALWTHIISGELPVKLWVSLRLLLTGYSIGLLLAFFISSLAVTYRFIGDILLSISAMFNPLPPVALLPLALLWFGFGDKSIIFVLVHAVLWVMATNIFYGFNSVPPVLKMVAQNTGISGVYYVRNILIPAALPSIISGMKIAWAFAWRTLIASELVFGASSGNGGIGWFIYENRNQLNTSSVFAGLMVIIIVGLLVEQCLFRTVEKITMKWIQ